MGELAEHSGDLLAEHGLRCGVSSGVMGKLVERAGDLLLVLRGELLRCRERLAETLLLQALMAVALPLVAVTRLSRVAAGPGAAIALARLSERALSRIGPVQTGRGRGCRIGGRTRGFLRSRPSFRTPRGSGASALERDTAHGFRSPIGLAALDVLRMRVRVSAASEEGGFLVDSGRDDHSARARLIWTRGFSQGYRRGSGPDLGRNDQCPGDPRPIESQSAVGRWPEGHKGSCPS